jgi:hypothetical protein
MQIPILSSTAFSARALSSPLTRKTTPAALLRTGGVRVIRSVKHCPAQVDTTSRLVSCKAFVPGNSEAV